MELKEMNQLPIVQLMNIKMEEQAKKQIYLEELTQKLEKIEKANEKSFETFVPVLQKLLPFLYLKAAMVETPIVLGEDELGTYVTEVDYETDQHRFWQYGGSKPGSDHCCAGFCAH